MGRQIKNARRSSDQKYLHEVKINKGNSRKLLHPVNANCKGGTLKWNTRMNTEHYHN